MEEIFDEDDLFSKGDYLLVLTIVKRGFETDVLEAEKSVNSTGAILIQGKGVTNLEKKFLGFNIDPENTVVLTLVEKINVVPTMKAIYSVVDFKSEAKGMVFALPVSLVAGMNDSFEKKEL